MKSKIGYGKNKDIFIKHLDNDLFYDIPEIGETNSHEYLIKQSTEYIDFNPIDDTIQALIDEINDLQQQNLDLNQQIADLSTPKV